LKKTYCAFAALVVVALLLPACALSTPDCSRPDVFCVGLVTNVGRIDDKSFNQAAWEGLQQAKEDGVTSWIQYIETTDARDYDLNIAVFGDAKYDAIVTVGSTMTDSTTAAAAKYPHIYFIGVDQTQDSSLPVQSNLVGLTFPEDTAGYLVGALAAAISTSHIVGAVCGTDGIPAIWRYCEGYRAGAAYADAMLDNTTQVSIVYHNDVGLDKTFSDLGWGAQTADSVIASGADVIFGAGGTTGNAAVIEAAAKKVYAIGVDVDQYYILPEAAPMILSSAIKLVSSGVTDLITKAKDAQNGKADLPSGNYPGTAGFAPYHDLDSKIPAKVKSMMDELNTGLLNGSIMTNVLPAHP